MEYLTYILIIFTICLVFIALLRPSLKSVAPDKPGDAPVDRREPGDSKHLNLRASERLDAPTPWGWPGHQGHAPARKAAAPSSEEGPSSSPGVSDSLHRWVDRLVSEKRTVEDQEYVLKKDASLRALLEDRYGQASKIRINGSGRSVGRAPVNGESRSTPPGTNGDRAEETDTAAEHGRRAPIRDVKTPWGW
ncbi:MAG: hypothetical protein KJO72_09265 [Gammaproteobacteria bacterium]|nr:hypothetical protein [Gammaproteobacteria bacterium]